jgi:probable addiction module antidote protein
MPKRTKSYNSWLLKELTDPTIAANYINAASDDSEEMLLVAIRNVAEAHKMARVAEKASVSRESLYRTLSDAGNPRLKNLRTILGTFGLKIKVTPDKTCKIDQSPRRPATSRSFSRRSGARRRSARNSQEK